MREKTIRAVVGLALMLTMLVSIGACEKWRYNECIKAGHSKGFCLYRACEGGR